MHDAQSLEMDPLTDGQPVQATQQGQRKRGSRELVNTTGGIVLNYLQPVKQEAWQAKVERVPIVKA